MTATSTERVAIDAGWLVAWDGTQHVAIEGGRLVYGDARIRVRAGLGASILDTESVWLDR